jgi:ABC-2 type transport system permease protein
MPLWTALGSLFMPLGIAFLIFVAKNPEISQKLGLVSAKANLVSYASTDWPAYMGFFGLLIAAGGFILFVLSISWIFGREFVDHTVKDMLAVPVPRGSIILAKFIVLAAWALMLIVVMFIAGLFTGVLIGLPGGSASVMLRGSLTVIITSLMTIWIVLPFALVASIGRGYLLPVGVAILLLMMTNLAMIIGWGEFFPWAVPGLYAQGKTLLGPASFLIVLLTGLAGLVGTYLWWKHADQNR